MEEFRSIKGTHDLLPDDFATWQKVESKIHRIMHQFGYGEIRTPVFEHTDLFVS